MGVNLRRLQIRVAEVLLDRAQRDTGGGECGGEGVETVRGTVCEAEAAW